MTVWFSADEHYGHSNIIKYCNRPFADTKEMDEEIIRRHNEVVKQEDTVYHIGDFTLRSEREAHEYISRLNGKNLFIRGSHDRWMKVGNYHEIEEIEINGQKIVLCHYAMRVWPESHYNSWHLYGHSHGNLSGIGKSIDVGVDTHNFYPYSFEKIKELMDKKEDNFNKLKD